MSLYLTAVAMGFFSGGHCLGMCGPLVLALPVAENKFSTSLFWRVLYNLGRIATYTVMGALVGLLGVGVSLDWAQANVARAAGVLLIAIALLQLIPFLNMPWFSKAHAKLTQIFSRLWQTRSPLRFFLLGMLNGFLPCGMVAAALMVAFSATNVAEGATFMAFFGLGTLPLMLAASIFGIYLSAKARKAIAVIGPVYPIALGILLLLRPALLHPRC